jgi:diguanylate cyclase (GGDEF)-like protein
MPDQYNLGRIFYRGNRNYVYIAINLIIIFIISAIIFLFSFNANNSIIMAAGLMVLAYSFFSLGKSAGVIYGIFYCFMNLVFILKTPEGQSPVSYVILLGASGIFLYFFYKGMDDVELKESQFEIWESELEKEKVEYTEKLSKIRGVIEGNKQRIENYKKLSDVAQKLTSTLDKREIAKIVQEAIGSILGDRQVDFTLMIRDPESEIFYPAVEENAPAKGVVKLYRKDPFDDWITKNKYTLLIKDIDEDFRFKLVRKDWIKFKSMIAIPLIEDKNITGILKFFSNTPGTFENEDARILNYLGDLCTTAVQNALLYIKTTELATRDGLTGLYIRRYFIARLEEEISRVKELNEPFTYLMIDIDHFKDCNDTHGHMFGDKVLKLLGEFLRDDLRDVDIIGRYGGEEFAIILPNTPINGAKFVAERLRQSFEKLKINVNENETIRLTLSIGGIEYRKEHKLTEIINKADKALYYSKENGRNKVSFWEDISNGEA